MIFYRADSSGDPDAVSTIHPPMTSRTEGEIVVSIEPYSVGRPVSLVLHSRQSRTPGLTISDIRFYSSWRQPKIKAATPFVGPRPGWLCAKSRFNAAAVKPVISRRARPDMQTEDLAAELGGRGEYNR